MQIHLQQGCALGLGNRPAGNPDAKWLGLQGTARRSWREFVGLQRQSFDIDVGCNDRHQGKLNTRDRSVEGRITVAAPKWTTVRRLPVPHSGVEVGEEGRAMGGRRVRRAKVESRFAEDLPNRAQLKLPAYRRRHGSLGFGKPIGPSQRGENGYNWGKCNWRRGGN